MADVIKIRDISQLYASIRDADVESSEMEEISVTDKTIYKVSVTALKVRTAGGEDVTTFIQLTDTPGSYSGQANKAAVVNAGATALEFRAIPLSVFGRTGAVVATTNDYNADQIDDSGTTKKFSTAAQLTQIATNTSDISDNASDISLNAGNILSNANDIAANAIAITNNTGNIAALVTAVDSKEDDLGNPALDGYVLSSTAAGARSWIPIASAPVSTVFGRTGAVVATTNDYNADQIDDSGTTNKFATAAQLAQIATNTSNISANAGSILDNANDISTNATNISNNATAISGKEDDLGNPVADGYLLSSTAAGARSWVAGFVSPLTTNGDILIYSSGPTRLGIGADAQVLTVSGGIPTWQNAATGFADPMTNRGDFIYRGSGGTTRLPLGTSGQFIGSNGTDALWVTPNFLSDITSENLADLADVSITSIAVNEVLQWNGTGWVNQTLAEAGIQPALGFTPANSAVTLTAGNGLTGGGDLTANRTFDLALSGLSVAAIDGADSLAFVDVSDSNNNKKATWADIQNTISLTESQITDLGSYITDITSESIGELTDVSITSIAVNEVLQWNGSSWVNQTLDEVGLIRSTAALGNDNRMLRSDGTGRLIQSTGIAVSDTDDITGVTSIDIDGTTEASSPTTGTFKTAGGISAQKNIISGGQVASALVNNGNLGSTPTINWNDGNVQRGVLNVNATFTLTNPVSGAGYTLYLIQDATGSRSITFPAAVKWPGGTAPTFSTAANAVDVVTLVYNGTDSVYYANAVLNLS